MAVELLKTIEQHLEEDLTRLKLIGDVDSATKRAINKDLLNKRSSFIKYVVSVATHPIGLRASVVPYNSSREDMLAYIMDMFSISETKLKKILARPEESIKAINVEDSGSAGLPSTATKTPTGFRKRHSWRPELRLRVYPPSFFYKEQLYLDNLYVRIYLFKNELLTRSIVNDNQMDVETSPGNKKVLNHIFKGLRLSSPTSIRPVNELKHLIRFKSIRHGENLEETKLSRTDYEMVQVVDEKSKQYNDIHMNIRRYYCETPTVYVLRFEFWLNSDIKRVNFFKRCARQLTCHRKCSSCLIPKHKRRQKYMNENQEFYGYINVKLTQVPSYPTKQNYPILSHKERKINSCEISLDLRNRRILEDNPNDGGEIRSFKTLKQEKPRKSIRGFIVNHVRLYINCFLYQSLPYISGKADDLNRIQPYRNLILDNLFYLPAFTLINQHRLQSNLDQFEDRCLRRVAILLMLIKLENTHDASVNPMKILLLSVIQNEYIVMRRPVDDRTMQEVDPFRDSYEIRGSRALIMEIELASLKEFVVKLLITRLEQWLIKQPDQLTINLNQSITLFSLKLFKTATSYIKFCIKTDEISNKLLNEVISIKKLVDQVLCKMAIERMRSKFEKVIELEQGADNRGRSFNLWLELFQDVHHIDRDLSLYWRRKGLDGLIKSEKKLISELGMFKELQKNDFSRVIGLKVDDYIK